MEERLRPGGAPVLAREGLLAEIRDGVAWVTLDRPAALNALSLAMLEGLAQWLDDWERDGRVRIVALRGAGDKAFCAGGDIRELRELFLGGSGAHRDFFEV